MNLWLRADCYESDFGFSSSLSSSSLSSASFPHSYIRRLGGGGTEREEQFVSAEDIVIRSTQQQQDVGLFLSSPLKWRALCCCRSQEISAQVEEEDITIIDSLGTEGLL